MFKLKEIWLNLSISRKLKLSYFLIIMVPILLLGGFSYISSVSFVNKQIEQETKNAIEKVTTEIENNLQQCKFSLSLIVNNFSFQEFLYNSEQLSNYELTKIANSYIGHMLYNVMLSNMYIDKVEIFSEKQINVLPDLFKTSQSVFNTDWYKTTQSSESYFWNYENDHLFLNKTIDHSITGDFLGIARIRINQSIITNNFHSFVNNPNLIEIYNNNNDDIIYKKGQEKVRTYQLSSIIPPLDWTIHYQFDKQSIFSFSNKQLFANYIVIVSCLVFVGLLIHFLAKSFLKRIFFLVHQMQEVREGNFNIAIDTSYNDEIGSLAQSFQAMISQINKLIKEKYIADLKQKELELYLLQEKVNPHFLYNILSTINWIALENNQMKISHITTNLATFYRTALNKGEEFNTLENEFSNIKSYIDLQLIARTNSFSISYDVSPKLLKEKVPNFILQPLVENAIEHGIDTLRNNKGHISIKTLSLEKSYQIIIEDNGKSLFNKYGESILEKTKYGYGLKNVDERIQLFTEGKYGLKIFTYTSGTRAILNLPYFYNYIDDD